MTAGRLRRRDRQGQGAARRGTITQQEFDALKAKALTNRDAYKRPRRSIWVRRFAPSQNGGRQRTARGWPKGE
jgi:hypothetical protein